MRYLLFVALFLYLSTSIAQTGNCERTGNFGETKLCFPQIAGYDECYLDPVIKEIADGTEIPANMVLAYYLSEDIFARKDSLDDVPFDDYFKLYGTRQMQEVEANEVLLKQMQGIVGQSLTGKTWDLLDKEIEQLEFTDEADIGVPKLIKSYQLTDDSFTFLLVATYQIENNAPYTLLISINGLLLRERLVWMAYYLQFDGKKSIATIEDKAGLVAKKILEENRF